jgi:hypothetical protein
MGTLDTDSFYQLKVPKKLNDRYPVNPATPVHLQKKHREAVTDAFFSNISPVLTESLTLLKLSNIDDICLKFSKNEFKSILYDRRILE